MRRVLVIRGCSAGLPGTYYCKKLQTKISRAASSWSPVVYEEEQDRSRRAYRVGHGHRLLYRPTLSACKVCAPQIVCPAKCVPLLRRSPSPPSRSPRTVPAGMGTHMLDMGAARQSLTMAPRIKKKRPAKSAQAVAFPRLSFPARNHFIR